MTGEFDGAFAKKDFAEGELVERGIMRRLPDGFDGNKCPYIFQYVSKYKYANRCIRISRSETSRYNFSSKI
jgi:hypothetical protein